MPTRKHPDDCPVIAVIGLAKNSGKTTTLNYLIGRYRQEKVALSSIGLDGEPVDLVTRLPKPRFQLSFGMVIATAAGCLNESDLAYDSLERTHFITPLGPILIVRVKKPAPVVIAGPTSNREMAELIARMKNYAARILIDGAFDRRTFGSIPALDGIVLSTGASVSPDMEITVRRTALFVEAFDLPIRDTDHEPDQGLLVRTTTATIPKKKSLSAFRESLTLSSLVSIAVAGAFTDSYAKELIAARRGGFELILADATKLLVSPENQRYLKALGIAIAVRHRIPVVLVTVNPYRPLGQNYDADAFLRSVRKAVVPPVINVLGKDEWP